MRQQRTPGLILRIRLNSPAIRKAYKGKLQHWSFPNAAEPKKPPDVARPLGWARRRQLVAASPVLHHWPTTQRGLSARKPRCDAPDRAQKPITDPDPIIDDPVPINIGLQMEWPVHDADAGTITWRGGNGLKSAALSTPSCRRGDLVIVRRLGHRPLNERTISRF